MSIEFLDQAGKSIFDSMKRQRTVFMDDVSKLRDTKGQEPQITRRIDQFIQKVETGDIYIYPHYRSIYPRGADNGVSALVLIPNSFDDEHLTDRELLTVIMDSLAISERDPNENRAIHQEKKDLLKLL